MQTSFQFRSGHERRRRAAEYVRMSTEHQQYSTENQADRIRDYAKHHNIEIVRTYADEGKSGLNIDGREGLQKLIADVQSKNTDFELILVYDVSRWGRFQDADESAHYVAAKFMLREQVRGPFFKLFCPAASHNIVPDYNPRMKAIKDGSFSGLDD